MVSLWFTFWAKVIALPSTSKYNLGISIGFQELTFQEVFCYDSKRATSNSIDGFKPNLCHFSFWKSLHKKHVFQTFWGLSGGKRSKFYKRLCTRVSLQNAVHDKSHPETRSLCAFCRVVVPTQLFTKHSLILQNDTKCCLESEPTPPATKCFWGVWWWIKKPMWVTTKWLRKRVAVKNPDSLLNRFWKFHSKSLVYFPGPRS